MRPNTGIDKATGQGWGGGGEGEAVAFWMYVEGRAKRIY